MLGNFRLNEPAFFRFLSSGETCELAFVLSGTVSHQFSDQIQDIVVPPGHAAVWNSSPREVLHECRADENIRFACISIRRNLLAALLEEETGGPFPFTGGMAQESTPCRIVRMNAPMQSVVRQIFSPPYNGCAGRIFLKGKVLELLSHTVAGAWGDGGCWSDYIRPQIRQAREMLLKAMVSPPSLEDLAAHVGLSVTSLTRGFRSAYGASVFGFLRTERLEKARTLLEAGEMNVTEVAYSVGFSSPAHLTRLFARHFQITPSQFRKGFLEKK